MDHKFKMYNLGLESEQLVEGDHCICYTIITSTVHHKSYLLLYRCTIDGEFLSEEEPYLNWISWLEVYRIYYLFCKCSITRKTYFVCWVTLVTYMQELSKI